MPGRSREPGIPGGGRRPPYLLLLLPVDFFSPPWLLRLLVLRALARSLGALPALLSLLSFPAAGARLVLPVDEEDLEFRDAIEMLLGYDADRAVCAGRSRDSRSASGSCCRL